MAAFSRFSESEEILKEDLNAFIRKAIPEKTKLGKKYGLKKFQR